MWPPDPFTTPFDLILHYIVYVPQWPICVPNLKFLVSTFPRYGGGPKISKRSGDPFTTSFDLILHFFVRTPSGQSMCQIKFLASTVPEIWKGSLNSLTQSLTHWLTDTQTDFIICPVLLTHWADKNVDFARFFVFKRHIILKMHTTVVIKLIWRNHDICQHIYFAFSDYEND